MAKRESEFQARLIRRIKTEIPGTTVLKNDANYIQGFPDLTILHDNRFAILENKRSSSASHRPNQDFYIRKFDSDGAFSVFMDPEHEEEIMRGLKMYFLG